jgi:thiol:disulfide interchange protein DsbD
MKFSRILPLAALLGLSAAAFGASPPAPKATFRFDPAGFKGDSTQLRVSVSIPEGWHIQSDVPLDEFLIPTTLHAKAEDVAFGKAVFPKAKVENIEALGGKVAVFEGEIEIKVPAKRTRSGVAAKALENSEVSVRYQACNNSQCLPPKEIKAAYAGK